MDYLQSLFSIPASYSLSDGSARYYSSMTPAWDIVGKVRRVHFEVSFNPIPCESFELLHHNAINTHLFKPKFYSKDSNIDEIFCTVPSREVLAHTLRSLAIIAHHLGNQHIQITINDQDQKYSSYTGGWQIEDNVIFGWRDSFLKFLKIYWLLESGVSISTVTELVCELENRLMNPDPQKLEEIKKKIYLEKGINVEAFNDVFHISYQDTTTPCISSANLEIHGKKLSIVQLSWGVTLSRDLAQTIVNLNPKIKKIGSVGGVGYAQSDSMQLDDIFLPTGIVTFDQVGNNRMKQFQNHIFAVKENKYFIPSRCATGYMHTVVPKLGVLSNTAIFKGRDLHISGFDMELEGFLDVLLQYPSIEFASSHYVMDLPFRGYSLGDTYYYRPYLEQFFKKFNRGKYSCFERVLQFVTET